MDAAIIGAGPAGMSAAVYLRRAGIDVTLFEAEMIGGQMTTTPEVQNVVGFGDIKGWELARKMSEHLKNLHIPVVGERVIGFDIEGEVKKLITATEIYNVPCVIIANGVKRRKLQCDGEDRLKGKGVSYCAVCDGNFFKGKDVSVIGGGNSALEDALYLSSVCNKVYLIHRRDEFRAERYYQDMVKNNPKIHIITPATVEKIQGEECVNSVVINHNGNQESLSVDGVFVAIGLVPDNEIFAPRLTLDQSGYIITNEMLATDIPGVYAVGDTVKKHLRQIVTAMSDGAIAAGEALKYIYSLSCKN